MTPAQATEHIAAALGETDPTPLAQIDALVALLDVGLALDVLSETESIEAAGGMLLPDGSRRRSKGGVFFFVSRKHLTKRQRREIFGVPPAPPAPTPPPTVTQAPVPERAPPEVEIIRRPNKAAPQPELPYDTEPDEPAESTPPPAPPAVEPAPVAPRRRIIPLQHDPIVDRVPVTPVASERTRRPRPPREPRPPRPPREPRAARAAALAAERVGPESPSAIAHEPEPPRWRISVPHPDDIDLRSYERASAALVAEFIADLLPLLRAKFFDEARQRFGKARRPRSRVTPARPRTARRSKRAAR